MAKPKPSSLKESALLSFVTWLSGVILPLIVGAGMIQKVLVIQLIPAILTQIAGWLMVIVAIISVLLAIFER